MHRRTRRVPQYRRAHGRNCKVQNYALVYEPAVLEDGVFVGPAVVFTNDHFPRSVSPDITMERGDDWEPVDVTFVRARR